jgi:adenylate kinase
MQLILRLADNSKLYILHNENKEFLNMSAEPKRIILFGAPGCGKGTQSVNIVNEYDLVRVAACDQIRKEIAANTSVGLKIKSILSAGEPIDDQTTMDVFESAIEKIPQEKGFVIDGVPRTVEQCMLLDQLLERIGRKANLVIYLNVDREELETRICGRLFHPGSGRTYHKSLNPPKKPMKDDITDEDLIIRKDDIIEVFSTRMEQYLAVYEQIVEYYENKGILKEISGSNMTPTQVFESIKALLL